MAGRFGTGASAFVRTVCHERRGCAFCAVADGLYPAGDAPDPSGAARRRRCAGLLRGPGLGLPGLCPDTPGQRPLCFYHDLCAAIVSGLCWLPLSGIFASDCCARACTPATGTAPRGGPQLVAAIPKGGNAPAPAAGQAAMAGTAFREQHDKNTFFSSRHGDLHGWRGGMGRYA